jgi:hypothetical protein
MNRRNDVVGHQLNRVDSSPLTLIRRAPGFSVRAFNLQSMISVALIALIASVLVEGRLVAAGNTATGTVEFSGGSVAVGIGYSWGSGTLLYHGRRYPLKVDGLSIVHVGANGYTASGTVYNLTKLSDFDGVYAAVSAGAAIAGGATATTMRNDHGVVIQMVSTDTGLNFQLGPKGVTLTLQ